MHEGTAPRLTIGTLAKRAGVGVETVRFYERQGLLERPRRPSTGYRNYPEAAIARIQFVRHAQALGFTLEDIAALLALKLTAGTTCAAVRGKAAAKLADVESRIVQLQSIRGALEKLVAACPGRGNIESCTILEALEATTAVEEAPNIPKRRTRRTKDMKSLEVNIEGMHCSGCASTIQALLKHEPGVQSVSVSYEKSGASIYYDPTRTDPQRLQAAIEKAGYRAGTR